MPPAGLTRRGRRVSRTLWALFTLFVIYGGTIPFHFTTDTSFILQKWSRVSWSPLLSPESGGLPSIPDVTQNILLFVPFGVLGMLALDTRFRSAVRRLLAVTALAMALSAFVEAAQLFTVDRIASFTDVESDTLGALLGAAAAGSFQRAWVYVRRWLARIARTDADGLYVLLVAVAIVCAAAWQPFDVTLDIGEIGGKIHALQRDVWQYTGLTDEGIACLQYALLAVAACRWLHAVGHRRPAVTTLVAGGTAAVGLEASQLFISSRMPGAEDALVRAGALIAGCALWTWGRQAGGRRLWVALVMAATAAATAMQMLSPFEVAPAHAPFSWLPFQGYYGFTTFQTLSHVIELWLLYFPLGFTMALAVDPPARAAVGAIVVAFIISAPIEWAQGWIVGRYPDVTDIAMSVLGAWTAVWVYAQRQRFFS